MLVVVAAGLITTDLKYDAQLRLVVCVGEERKAPVLCFKFDIELKECKL